MKSDDRRKRIIEILMAGNGAVKGETLSDTLAVSRQTIVHDISLLKAEGYEIIPTSNGYVLGATPYKERVFKLRHTTEQTPDELGCIISLGGLVMDVFVCHKVYGKLSAKLSIFNQEDIDHFIEGVRSGKSTELMNVTGGYHHHTVRADSEAVLDKIETALRERGYLVEQ